MQEFIATQIVSGSMHICGNIVDLAFDVGKNHFAEKVDEHELRKNLEVFIEHHRKYNEVCSLVEEIDFEGLAQYIRFNLLSDVSDRIFNPNRKLRGRARQEIVDKAIAYAGAENIEAKIRVGTLIGIILDMMRDFYRNKITRKEWILATEIVNSTVESVSDVVMDSGKLILDKVASSESEIVSKLNNLQTTLLNNAPFSLDNYYAMAANGDIGGITENLQLISDVISRGHPLYPDYGYKIYDSKLRSVPLTDDATKKYQPRFSCKGTVAMGGHALDHLDESTIDYADRHQLDITLTVAEAEKLLGTIHDPDQTEAKSLVGQTITRKPKKFPPAFPCKLIMNGETIYDYLEMRTAEILDDGTYIVDNREQKNCHFRMQIRFRALDVMTDEERNARIKKLTYNIKQDNPTNSDSVKFLRLLKMASEGGVLELFALNLQKNILAGNTDPFSYETEFESVDKEIDFTERICDIESYIGHSIQIPRQITEKEYYQVLYVSQIIRGDENEFTWKETSFKGIVDDHFREKIKELTDEYHRMAFVGTSTARLFGEEFEIPIMREYRSCKIKDLDRIRKKVEYADNGDEIKMTYIAGENNTYIDKLKPNDFEEHITA